MRPSVTIVMCLDQKKQWMTTGFLKEQCRYSRVHRGPWKKAHWSALGAQEGQHRKCVRTHTRSPNLTVKV